jgi:8-oxo-dGTP pyrophosphatase MutT (NUDIX family)
MVGNSSQTSVGLILPQSANEFSKFPSVFSVNDKEVRLIDRSEWFDDENSEDSDDNCLLSRRSEAIREVLETLRDTDAVPALRGWRDEAFSVRESFHSPPKLIVERAAAVLLGVPAYGVFVNGYTCEDSRNGNRPTHVWVGRRSPTKATWPGRLDSLAAGGLGAGSLPREAMINECCEEAGIDVEYLKERLRAVSAVSYTGFNEDLWGLKRDVLFCFDLQVPPDFEPVAVDGEMESFQKMPIQMLVELLAEPIQEEDDSDNQWKPNVGVVLTDFLVRHDFLDVDDPNFLQVIDALRGAKCA